MDATLHALGEILLKSVPTFLFVVFLNFYLKAVFFTPLGKIREQRYMATEGAKKLAQKSLEHAAARTAEYEAAMRAARGEVYQTQEQLHKQLQERQAAELSTAHRRAQESVNRAKGQLEQDVAAAKDGLAAQSETLANQIAESVLRRSAA